MFKKQGDQRGKTEIMLSGKVLVIASEGGILRAHNHHGAELKKGG